ncbi:MAG: TorF family putative porin [Sulfitobacter sp.]|uniref:TorF family putative porin n=1 Tax=Sulfitobacter sp. TaxID=1903071 RepID=UPI0040598E97
MRRYTQASALAITLLIPTFATAQDVSVSAGATLTSRYLFNGLEQSTGAALQPWLEAEYQGFYAGIWASNTARSLVGSSAEVDLYLGYRNAVGQFSYDLGYTRYYYRNPNVDCCGEVILALGYTPAEPLELGLRFAHDPVADYVNTRISLDYAINDKIGISTNYGTISKGGHDYWKVGGSYAISDNFGVDVAWEDTNISDGLIVVSLNTSFNLR